MNVYRPFATTLAAVPALMGLAVILASGCTVDSAPAGENIDEAGMTWEEFLGRIYQEPDTGIYIVNGDEAIEGERALRRFYEDNFAPGALIVHRVGGADAKWSDAQKLNLTYCISNNFGANKAAVVNAMASATAAWKAATNINYTYVSAQDATCTASNNNVLFDVNPVNSGGQYLARAFFPDSSRAGRNVLIDNTAFGSIAPWTLAGILRHELGHSLGFRHEHTRPESGTCYEDANWRALTAYDSKSVMHYPQCNGTQTGDLVITATDAQGAVALYGAPGGGGGGPVCAHDRCVTGVKLDGAACGGVVPAVITGDAYCGNTSWDSTCVTEVRTVGKSLACSESTGTCAHSPCAAGAKLTSGCDSTKAACVAKVCAADAYCCSTSWDSVCVGEVASKCGNNCN